MISWFFGQFDGQSHRPPWQAIRQQAVPASCRAGVLSGVIAVEPERGTDESAVPLLRPRLGSSLSASSRSKTALMLYRTSKAGLHFWSGLKPLVAARQPIELPLLSRRRPVAARSPASSPRTNRTVLPTPRPGPVLPNVAQAAR